MIMDKLDVGSMKKVEDAAALLKTLAHPARLLIVKTLMGKTCNVTNLEKIAGLSQSGVSQHLRILRLSGVIEPERDGKEICYKIVNKKATEIIDILCD